MLWPLSIHGVIDRLQAAYWHPQSMVFLQQAAGIAGGITRLVIIKVTIDLPAPGGPLAELFGMPTQHPVGITAGIGITRTVQAHINEVRGDMIRCAVARQFIDTKGSAVLFQQGQRLRVQPAWIAEFEGVAKTLIEAGEKVA